MKIKPLRDRVAVKIKEEEEEEKKTKSGIVLPDTAKKDEKPQQGEIVAVGSGCCTEENGPEVEEGDVVVFDKFAGTELTLEGEDYLVLSIEDVLAVIG
ncbi:MAG TPA: co-chaperone GroES [Halanaerobiales bacterium]|nr:co-chaperone GroES [Halanaerobiales bacterium]